MTHLAAVLFAALSLTTAPVSPEPADLTAQVKRAADMADKKDCKGALAIVARIKARPDFAGQPTNLQRVAYAVDLHCAYEAEDWAKAYAAVKAVTSLPDAPAESWTLRFLLAGAQGQQVDAVESIERLAASWPDKVSELDDEAIYQVNRSLLPKEMAEARFRYLAALDRANFRPKKPFATPDGLQAQYALLLAERGDKAKALAVADRLESPDAILKLAVDRNFTEDVKARPQLYDAKAAAESALVAHRRELAQNPRLLEGPVTVAGDLRLLGREAEALALLDETARKLDAPKPEFDDLKKQLPWFLNERAAILQQTGRGEAAIDVLKKGAAMDEEGQANVSQVINLAEFQTLNSRPEEAIRTLADFETRRKASGYGMMALWTVRACAYAQLGRTAELAQALAYLRAHAADNPAALTHGLLCAGDEEGAAQTYLSRLADPELRQDALLALSRFRPVPDEPAYKAELRRRVRAVGERQDVKAAVAKAGRTIEAPLVDVFWGDV